MEAQEKPTEELLTRYTKSLEYFLQFHQMKVKVILHDRPVRIESYINQAHTGTTIIWVRKLEITTPEGIFEIMRPFNRQNIEPNITDKEIWLDAYYIQGALHSQLNLPPRAMSENNPYWQLWQLYPKD